MGTQQILLLALSVIIVGISISVGIAMFSNQSYNNNCQSVALELQNYSVQVLEFWLMPISLGGVGKNYSLITKERLSLYIGFDENAFSHTSESGEFKIVSIADSSIVLRGLGSELRNNKKPIVTSTINVYTGKILSVVSNGTNI